MQNDLAQKAISAAISGNWENAVEITQKILQIDKENIDALNRLAKAYSELGNLVKAKSVSSKVLGLDPYNKIANKCIERWKGLKQGESVRSHGVTGNLFIEEPGKTKIVSLINLGGPEVLAMLDAGDEVKFDPHGHRVSVTTIDKKYVGRLPDDIGSRVKQLLTAGNEYMILVKSIDQKEIKVFIRVVKTVPHLANVPSFTSEKIDYVSFTPPELVHKKDDLEILTNEED